MSLSWKAWNTLASKIHPPLPISPKDSAHLLALLNASFKQHLEHQLPQGLSNGEYDNHLSSILRNPLFVKDDRVQSSKGSHKPFGRIQELLQRPMDAFNEQVATGTATIHTASLCLQAQYNNCLASPIESLSDALGASGAGTVVRNWLWASDLEQEALKFPGFIGLLMEFLVAEQQQQDIMRWLQTFLPNETSLDTLEASKRYGSLLKQFIKSEVSTGQGSKAATAYFVSASDQAAQAFPKIDQVRKAFDLIAHYLIDELSRLERTSDLQKTTLNPLARSIKGFSKDGTYLYALRGLHLVQTPTPGPALQYFQNVSAASLAKTRPKKRAHIILTGLRTAEMCLAMERKADSIKMLRFLQENFKDEFEPNLRVNSNRGSESAKTQDEKESLQLLDSLAIT